MDARTIEKALNRLQTKRDRQANALYITDQEIQMYNHMLDQLAQPKKDK